MPLRKRNIACLESLWDRQIENRLNVIPMLELISRTQKVKFSHLNCNTRDEFIYNLSLLPRRNYGILYLAFHGSSGVLYLHDGTEIDFPALAELMNDKFTDWIVHFGSCGVFKKQKDLTQFVEQTKVILATGYTKTVDWIESASLELLFFQALQSYKSPKLACRSILNKYPDLVKQTGFCSYSES
jgi:hypothetical protein